MPNIIGLNKIYENKELAIASFGTLGEREISRRDDGKQILARYYDEEGNVASLIGIYHYKRTDEDNNIDYGNIEVKDYSMTDVEYITSIVEYIRDIEQVIEINADTIDFLRARLAACCGEPEPEPPVQHNYLTFTNNSTGPAKLVLHDLGDNHPVVYYSLDEGETFRSWELDDSTSGTRSVLVDQGRNVKLYGDNPNGFSFSSADDGFSRFEIDSDTNNFSWDCSGNIMTLISIDEPTEIPNEYCFYGLFWQTMATLHTAPELPATTLKPHCYENMFIKCFSLEKSVELPALEVPDFAYHSMFQDCFNLTEMLEMSATTLGICACLRMFYDCQNLTIIPPAMHFVNLVNVEYGSNNCTAMFMSCHSLTEMPYLPATTLATYCYCDMFCACESLVITTELPAEVMEMGCYKNMFKGCVSLTTVPNLPAMTLAESCYESMFEECAGLTVDGLRTLPALTLARYCYCRMFAKCNGLEWMAGPRFGMLPATTLADYCYKSMFEECLNLQTVPFLPAESLEHDCYESMFKNSPSAHSVVVSSTTITENNFNDYISGWLDGNTYPGDDMYGDIQVPLGYGSTWEAIQNAGGIPSQWHIRDW